MKKDELDEYQRPGTLGRREFLKIAGGGIVVAVSWGESAALQEEARRRGAGYPEDFNAYLLIGADGRVTGYTGKVELGQGAITSLPQMIADELDVPYQAVDMVMGDTDLCPWDMGTFGSLTTRMFGPALRTAAAEARAVLLELAAERLKIPKEGLSVKDGVVFDKANPANKVSYGELASGKRIERHISPKPSVKSVGEWAVMGKPFFHKDAVDKVTGKALFAGDVRLPGMLYAKVLRPPAHGAKIRSLDTSAADKVGGIRIVQDGDFVAALHELPDVAAAALDLIKTEYDIPFSAGLNADTIFDHLLSVAPEARVVDEGGDLKQGESLAANIFDETYLNGYVAHAPMEPHTALADVKGGKATVWASTQAPFRVKEEVAQAVGIPPADVHVIMPFVGGGFGGKTRNIQASQAARLSKIAGKPVQVAWSREDEFFNDSFRPAALVKIRSGTDGSGKIVFWDYGVYFAGERSSAQFYSIPHHRTVSRGEWGGGGTGTHPFAVGAWRAPGSNTNVFARESQVDIMAAKSGMDALEFRMKNLSDERMKRVLAAAADKFGWTPAPLPSRRGMAIVCADYNGTYVATAAQINVDAETGWIHVDRVICAQDMGQCINPQGAVIQIEGCITMGLGYTLTEEIRFKGGEIRDLNFDSYELPRFSWLPKIETVLLPNDSLPPSGGGEPAIINMGAVVANALFDATGTRVRRLPLTPSRVRAAMAALEK
jgi:nicotinate dehydrogenase subunit B